MVHMVGSLVLLVLALSSGARAAAIEDVRQESTRWLAAAFKDPKQCKFMCDGEGSEDAPLSALPAEYECWGLFKMWCGSPPSSEGVEEASGSACQGHFKSFMKEEGDSAHVAVVCEGGSTWISRRTSTCPHSGKRYKKMMGSLHAGASLSMMTFPDSNSSSGGGSSSPSLDPASPSLAAGLAAVRQALDSVPELVTARAQLEAAATGSGVTEEEGTFELESHAHGFHVSWRATKEVPPTDVTSTAAAEWDELEADAKDVMGPSWADWLPGSHGAPPSRHDESPPSMLCNDEPAWLHGALPCWGNFSIAATRSESSKPCEGSKQQAQLATLTQASTRALRAGPRDSWLNVKHSLEAPSELKGITSSMRAECDGLWTGWFMTCHGVSTSHAEVMRDGEHAMDKRTICTGRQGLHFIHKPMVWGMSVSCKGDSVMALKATIKPPPTAAAAA